ncbi:MAG: hypothetical protein WD042_07100 [Phycisphaeraceae bacterium]
MRTLMTASVAVSLMMMLLLVGCQRATVEGSEGRRLTLTVPRSVTIQRGQTQMVEVGIKRHGFTDGVRVSLAGLPSGVSARDSAKTVETDAATLVLEATRTADLVSNQAVTVTVAGPDGMKASEQIRLNVVQ